MLMTLVVETEFIIILRPIKKIYLYLYFTSTIIILHFILLQLYYIFYKISMLGDVIN